MKTSIEEINGKRYTVVYCHPLFDALDDYAWEHAKTKDGCIIYYAQVADWHETHIATALPALPRKPKPEDAALLYRYLSEGIILHPICADDVTPLGECITTIYFDDAYAFSHATDSEGNRIDVAIGE